MFSSSSVPTNNPLLNRTHVPTLGSRIALFGRDGDVPIPVMATGTCEACLPGQLSF